MIQPKTLPFTKSKSYIFDRMGKQICDIIWSDEEDKEYLLKSCNNFPKAIELLKSLSALPGSEIYEFLKQTENE